MYWKAELLDHLGQPRETQFISEPGPLTMSPLAPRGPGGPSITAESP